MIISSQTTIIKGGDNMNYNEFAKVLFTEGYAYNRKYKQWYLKGTALESNVINKAIRLRFWNEITKVQEVSEIRYAFDDLYGF